MSKWPQVPIGDVMAGFFDGPHATPKPVDDGPIYLGIKNITEDGHLDLSQIRHISWDDFPKWVRRVEPTSGDLVFTYEASLHRYAMIPDGFKGCLGRRTALIRPDRANVDGRFLLYQFLGPEWRGEVTKRLNIGSTVDRVPLIDFPTFPIRLPALDVQRKIAAVLAAYDELIENNLRRIEILEEMAHAVYREWFVNFRFPGHEDVALVDSSLGPIPEGWETSTLGDESSVVMGQSPKSEFYNNDGRGLPFHQGVANFGSLFPDHVKHCTVESRIAEEGDTLVSVRAPVGRINVADTRMVIGRGLAAVRHLDGECPGFHYRQLRHVFREEDSMGGGTIYKAITKDDLLGVPWLLPPAQIRLTFDSLERPLFSLMANLTKQIRHLRATRDLLLPKLVSGAIDVSDLDIDTEWLAS